MTAYTLCGLVLESEFEFPELPSSNARPDVRIRLSSIDVRRPDSAPEGSWYASEAGSVVFAWEDLPAMQLVEGQEILIQPWAKDSPLVEAELRSCLLGPVLSMVLLQRGRYPLHSSAALLGARALAFCAPSGTGKSTLAAACLRRGHRLMSDDVTALEVDGARPMAHAGRSTLKLSPESWRSLGQDPEPLPRVDSEDDKRARAMGAGFHDAAAPLAGILSIEDGPEEMLERLAPRDALLAVLRNCHRFDLAAKVFGHDYLLNLAARVTERVPVHRLVRRKSFEQLEGVVDLVEELARRPEEFAQR